MRTLIFEYKIQDEREWEQFQKELDRAYRKIQPMGQVRCAVYDGDDFTVIKKSDKP